MPLLLHARRAEPDQCRQDRADDNDRFFAQPTRLRATNHVRASPASHNSNSLDKSGSDRPATDPAWPGTTKPTPSRLSLLYPVYSCCRNQTRFFRKRHKIIFDPGRRRFYQRRPCHQHYIAIARQPVTVPPIHLAQQPPRPHPLHGTADLPAGDDAEPQRGIVTRAEPHNHKSPDVLVLLIKGLIKMRRPDQPLVSAQPLVRSTRVAATPAGGRTAASPNGQPIHNQQLSPDQFLAAFAATTAQHLASIFRGHAGTKSMGALARNSGRLIRSFH